MSGNLKHAKQKRISKKAATAIALIVGIGGIVAAVLALLWASDFINNRKPTPEKPDTNSSIFTSVPTTDTEVTDEFTFDDLSTSSDTQDQDMATDAGSDEVIDNNIVNSNAKRVAFTFDGGPYTLGTKIADEFKKYNGHATFFVFGERVSGEWADSMKYVAESGNEIGIYGYKYGVNFAKCDDNTYETHLKKTADAIKKVTGESPTLFRPSSGTITKERVSECEYSVIMWSVSSDDWEYRGRSSDSEKGKNIDKIVNNVLDSVSDGDIIVMQELYENSYDALCIILKTLHAQGYEFVTVSELIGEDIQVGTRYSKVEKE